MRAVRLADFTRGLRGVLHPSRVPEMVGGVLMVIGFLTRPVAALFFGFMAVAAFHVHWKIGYFWTGRGLEMPLLLLILALVILIRGGGKYSVDRRIGREV